MPLTPAKLLALDLADADPVRILWLALPSTAPRELVLVSRREGGFLAAVPVDEGLKDELETAEADKFSGLIGPS